MPVIRKLSAEIIGQIAAGEVVERPASAVKELVENSIDAGAHNVTVELREGGIKYLRVTDNGCGIPAEQVRLAFERHATSKIAAAADLYNIHTLGFRGEALASVAAVSRVTLTTRTQEAPFGTRAVVEAGEFIDIRQAASPVGTTIVVEDLFLNTPVRLKFLKKPAVEASLVADYMQRLILSRPDVAFRFVSQGKTVYHSMGDGSVESALYSLYGREAFKRMRKVSGHMNGVLLSGYVGGGDLARGNRQQQSFFVNGRFFRSQPLSRALEEGCEGQVMVGRFPMCALFLEVPAQQVDVNVHPNKLEVRFQNEPAVAEAVRTLVREAMRGETLGERLSAVQSAPSTVEPKADFSLVRLDNPLDNQTAALAQAGAPQSDAGPVADAAPEPRHPVLTEAQKQELSALKPVVIPDAPARSAMAHSAAPAAVARASLGAAVPAPVAPAAPARERPSSAPAQLPPVSGWFSAGPAPRPSGAPEKPATAAAAPAALPRKPAAAAQASSPAPGPALSRAPEMEQQTLAPQHIAQSAPLRLVGIVFDTYWIFESGDRLLLVDQHAAHERILYDRLMARFEKGAVSQQLLSPQLVRLTAHDMALVSEFGPVLADAGFEVEPFDDTCVAVKAIPTLFGENEPPRELLLEALDEWQAGRGQVTRERMRRRVAQMACKHAIKGGDRLNETQVRGFLQEILQSDCMPTCPHGRPIVTEITRYALEKRFKRVQ
ncbi:MAG: DNA mismatch repair endonuclease MutL [Candidatus Limiplasma sp.]|nr:DNA mismatch repair endonuclease MutL [Candidatus Limiplasma sp.]